MSTEQPYDDETLKNLVQYTRPAMEAAIAAVARRIENPTRRIALTRPLPRPPASGPHGA